jgi:23S rRNA (uracil1939-C5)-methyltransferase
LAVKPFVNFSLGRITPFLQEQCMGIGVVSALDHEGRGIVRENGKAIFVDGALPGELVEYASFRKKSNYELAHLIAIHKPSSARVTPRCPYFGICGGCAMQHLDARTQVAVKQRILEDNLARIGRVKPEQILPPIFGPAWQYRHRARFGVRKIPNKEGVLIGFHEKRSSYISDMPTCDVLPPRISAMLLPLRKLVGSLSIVEQLSQIEMAVGAENTAFVLRILAPLTRSDESKVKAFADQHHVIFYLQPKGPDTAYRFYPESVVGDTGLHYALPEFDLKMPFRPTDFTQVNHAVNQVMVRRALRLLAPRPHERIADLFCGLGNFTLPIARSGAEVVGVEGSAALVQRGRSASAAHGLADCIDYKVANLFECSEASLAALGYFDKMLIDPPREGAFEVVNALKVSRAPQRIVYVSCDPATLARDAAVLVGNKGYVLKSAGVINMFPHTAHVESIAVFERSP